eukprot:Awhi_evm1s2507
MTIGITDLVTFAVSTRKHSIFSRLISCLELLCQTPSSSSISSSSLLSSCSVSFNGIINLLQTYNLFDDSISKLTNNNNRHSNSNGQSKSWRELFDVVFPPGMQFTNNFGVPDIDLSNHKLLKSQLSNIVFSSLQRKTTTTTTADRLENQTWIHNDAFLLTSWWWLIVAASPSSLSLSSASASASVICNDLVTSSETSRRVVEVVYRLWCELNNHSNHNIGDLLAWSDRSDLHPLPDNLDFPSGDGNNKKMFKYESFVSFLLSFYSYSDMSVEQTLMNTILNNIFTHLLLRQQKLERSMLVDTKSSFCNHAYVSIHYSGFEDLLIDYKNHIHHENKEAQINVMDHLRIILAEN